jgi:replication factor C subunit 1
VFCTIKMPADIRSFFGGGPKPSQGSQSPHKQDEPTPKKAAPKKKGRASRVVQDSDDDDDDTEEAK